MTDFTKNTESSETEERDPIFANAREKLAISKMITDSMRANDANVQGKINAAVAEALATAESNRLERERRESVKPENVMKEVFQNLDVYLPLVDGYFPALAEKVGPTASRAMITMFEQLRPAIMHIGSAEVENFSRIFSEIFWTTGIAKLGEFQTQQLQNLPGLVKDLAGQMKEAFEDLD